MGQLAGALLRDLPFVTLVLLYVVVGLWSSRSFGVPDSVDLRAPWGTLAGLTMLYAFVASVVVICRAVLVEGDSLLSTATWRSIAMQIGHPIRVARFAIVFMALPLLMHVFIDFKEAIPTIQSFVWDERFMKWDRWMHFGRHPYEWIQPLVGRPSATVALDLVYFLWIPIMWFTAIWQGWHGTDERLRARYLLSFGLCWVVIGTGLAILFSSAGPVYYDHLIHGPDPYEPLLAYLAEVGSEHDLRALRFHALLWEGYTNPDVGGVGISAMPSMHVALAVLMTLLGFSTHRLLGWAYAVFAGLIMVGSVHLAWHYAIDGYAGAVGAVVIWWVSGRVVDRWWSVTEARLA